MQDRGCASLQGFVWDKVNVSASVMHFSLSVVNNAYTVEVELQCIIKEGRKQWLPAPCIVHAAVLLVQTVFFLSFFFTLKC